GGTTPLDTRHGGTHSVPPPSHLATRPSHSPAGSVPVAPTPHTVPQLPPPPSPHLRSPRRRRTPLRPRWPPPAGAWSRDSSAQLVARSTAGGSPAPHLPSRLLSPAAPTGHRFAPARRALPDNRPC